MAEYAKMLDDQEAARKAFFAKTSEKQDMFAAENEKAREEERQRERAMELRDLAFAKAKQEADVQKERRAKEKRWKKQQEINKWLEEKIQKKRDERRRVKSQYKQVNDYAKRKAAEAKAVEDDAKRKRRQDRMKYKEELAAQIASREHLFEYKGRMKVRKATLMSDVERTFNKSLLQEIKIEAPELLSPPNLKLRMNNDNDGGEDDAPIGGIF